MNKLEINYSSDYMYNDSITESVLHQVYENEIQMFKENINTINRIVLMYPEIQRSVTIELIIALMNFDIENSGTPYSESLKSSFRYGEDEFKPMSLVARVKEFYMIIEELFTGEADDFMFVSSIESALALHKNRILTDRSCVLSNDE